MYKKLSCKARGFTLIELLIVIAILGVLAGFVLIFSTRSQTRARDAVRKADLKSLTNALQLYHNDYGVFPINSTGIDDPPWAIRGCGAADPPNTACNWGEPWVGGTHNYGTLPSDPRDDREYRYERTDVNSYTLSACLEINDDADCEDSSENVSDAWCVSDASGLGGCIYLQTP